ncbi:hypothetical protein VTJ04DRAFT_9711 [Mycothermus thermophilus]|uniref:uncharacterized protein n=1 Tax=Humicola insolens TaxID=85995 RepID=UPI003742FA0D
MTSNDLRDVLNLPSDSSTPRPSKKQKTTGPRPNLKGLAREVQNLGGDNPIAIVPEVSFYKKRRFASRKPAARWELKPFTNSARNDGGALVLRHWRRKTDHGPPPDGAPDGQPAPDGSRDDQPEDSAFAKFNVKVSVPEYTDDQYRANLQSSEWTKEETDYLMELCRDYDLRWPIIWDRYEYSPAPPPELAGQESTAVMPAPKPRSMEELKARYYEVAAKMMAVNKPAQYMTRPEFELYEMMQNFNPEQERRRKEFALNTMARSRDEAREEESLLLEIKRIMARTERFNEERRELYNRLDFPATDKDITAFKSSAGLQTLLQNLMSTDKAKKRKSILGPNDGASPNSAGPASAGPESATAPANRRESIAASSSRRESDARGPASAEPTPTTATSTTAPAAASASASAAAANKKKGSAAQQPERRKLSAQEEQVYGVSYHDRLGSGPTFRYERINKLYSHKSGQQQLRMTNALAELDVPPRLIMPTAAVTAQFEQLWVAVTALVDLRKLSDKLDAEIRLEEAKKAEREKAKAAAAAAEAEKEKEKEKEEGGAGGDEGEGKDSKVENAEKGAEKEGGEQQEEKDKKEDGPGAESGGGGADAAAAAPEGAEPAKAASTGGGDGQPGGGEDAPADAGADADGVIKKEDGEQQQQPEEEVGGEKTGHKRSASELSSTSDKSAKRLKK